MTYLNTAAMVLGYLTAAGFITMGGWIFLRKCCGWEGVR